MILLAAILMTEMPPPPSGQPIPYGGVEILDPIAPAVRRYSTCLREKIDIRTGGRIVDKAGHRAAAEAAIADCAAVRVLAVADAEAALSSAPDYQDPERRRAAIRHAFEGTEFQRLNLFEILEAIRQERKNDAENR